MIAFTYNDEKVSSEKPITTGEYIKKIGLLESVLACKVNGKVVSADHIIKDGDSLIPFTISTDEGYLIYKESIILVFLHAVEQMDDAHAVFVRQSVNKSTYFEIDTKKDRIALAEEIKRKMHSIIEEEESFRSIKLKRSVAAELFRENGEAERAEEIDSLPADFITVCKTAKRYHLTYQPLAYSVKALKVFDIQPYDEGFLLKYPTDYTVDNIPLIKSGVKVHNAIEDYRDWITTIGVENIFALNKTIKEKRAAELVNMAEGLHEKRLSRIADKIKENPQIKVILIAGPSSSGKTSFANRLCLHLKINHINPVVISLDDYYVDDTRMPRDEKGEMDFECVEAIDYELFNEHLSRLAAGECVELPKYDFKIRKRVKGKTLSLKENQIIIAEGIHALNELLTSRVQRENKYKIYLSCLTSLCLDEYNAFSPTDNRLLRRMVRDAAYRNTPAEGTFKLWKSVRRGEQKYIFPFECEADEVFNSSLVYELSVLKKPALELLAGIGPHSEYYSRAQRLIKLLSYFEYMDSSPIPPTSLIREFVGGSTIVD